MQKKSANPIKAVKPLIQIAKESIHAVQQVRISGTPEENTRTGAFRMNAEVEVIYNGESFVYHIPEQAALMDREVGVAIGVTVLELPFSRN